MNFKNLDLPFKIFFQREQKNTQINTFREKPTFSHPVTGNFMVQYTENDGGPSPCSYVLPRKSCRERNAPAYTFGSKCAVEKSKFTFLTKNNKTIEFFCFSLHYIGGGSRTAWDKQWFAHSDPYTTKVDFKRESAWPTPFHYTAKPSIGAQVTKISFPAWTIAKRFSTNPTIATENNPGPDTYDTISAFRKLKAKTTNISLKSRTTGLHSSTSQITSNNNFFSLSVHRRLIRFSLYFHIQ